MLKSKENSMKIQREIKTFCYSNEEIAIVLENISNLIYETKDYYKDALIISPKTEIQSFLTEIVKDSFNSFFKEINSK